MIPSEYLASDKLRVLDENIITKWQVGEKYPFYLIDGDFCNKGFRQFMFFVWYDDSPTNPLSQKLTEASSRFGQKYGTTPTHCLISEKNGTGLTSVEGITFETAENVPQNYLWLQVQEKAGK